MEDDAPEMSPRIFNLAAPMMAVTVLSVFFFWYFKTDPNKAMLVALFFSLLVTEGKNGGRRNRQGSIGTDCFHSA